MKASCPCGSQEFLARRKPPLVASDTVLCARCGKQRTYGGLLDEIGEQAMRQATASLRALKKKQKKHA